MKKRIITVFLLTAVCSFVLIVRVGIINAGDISTTAAESNTKRINVAESRGYIYDRNYIPIVNNTSYTQIAVNPTLNSLKELKNTLPANEFSQIENNIKNGFPTLFTTENYKGNSNDINSFHIVERYTDNDYMQNLIGYTDTDGNGKFGLELAFDNLLKANSGSLKLDYSVTADGRALTGKSIQVINNNYNSKAGLVLTIDYNIQRFCEQALKNNNIETGAAVVLDAETSEILALATAPSIDRNNLEKSLTDENSPFINRALTSYSVGSIFKPVVAAAAIDSGIDISTEFTCNGYTDIFSNRFNCHDTDGHGNISMTEAMEQSCNCYFIKLGLKTGKKRILSLASALGLGKEITLADGITSESGNVPTEDEINSDSALANISFGQGSLLATPLQIAALYCTFVNGGYYREPYLLKEIVDENMTVTSYYKSEINNKVITESTNEKIKEMLFQTVENGLGKNAKPAYSTAAGKTATAQTGWYKNGVEVLHTWFAGYFPADEPKYVIVVMNENGEYSSTDSAPVFKEIADSIIEFYDLNKRN